MATMALLNLCYGESCKSVCTQVIHRNFSDSSEQFWAGLVCIVHVAAKTDNVWFICFKFDLIFIYVRLIFIYARYTIWYYICWEFFGYTLQRTHIIWQRIWKKYHMVMFLLCFEWKKYNEIQNQNGSKYLIWTVQIQIWLNVVNPWYCSFNCSQLAPI